MKLSETAEGMKRLETVDTIYIKDVATQFRYKLLRDTIERVKIEVVHDSIPYEVRITKTVVVTKPPTVFDKLCKVCFFLLLGTILFWTNRFARKFFYSLFNPRPH